VLQTLKWEAITIGVLLVECAGAGHYGCKSHTDVAVGSYLAERGLVQLGSYRARHDLWDPKPKPKPKLNPNPNSNPPTLSLSLSLSLSLTLPIPLTPTRHDIWDLVFVNASHLNLNLTAWQGSGHTEWAKLYNPLAKAGPSGSSRSELACR
jgi:hypothetical protein